MWWIKYKFTWLSTALLIASSPLPAADLSDFLVNDDGSPAAQNYPSIAVAADGQFVISWMDRRSGSADIYSQRYTRDGAAVDRNILVNDDIDSAYQSQPAIAADRSGFLSLVWKDYRNGSYPFGPDIFLQQYDTTVVPLGANYNVTNEGPDSLKDSPDIDLSPWGRGVVVWEDYRFRNWDVYAQIISSDGSPVGSNIRVNSDVGNSQQHSPKVAVSSEGWFVVTWYDNRLGNDDIFAQRFDSLGNPIGTNLKVNSDFGDTRQAFPDVATDGAGHFTVVWVDWRNGNYPTNPDIYARKFDTNLVAMRPDTKINTDGSIRAQRQPVIAADRKGNVAIIWADSTGSSWDIVGQMIDVDGRVRETNFRANSDGDSAQLQPQVALDGRYRYVTWADKRSGNFDIYASVAQYNDPMLVPTPSAMTFQMESGGVLPPSQSLQIDHAGYNSLSFEVISSTAWLTVLPTTGMTPATLSVAIAEGALSNGSYIGYLTLVDIEDNDSSVVISVRLDVTAPNLQLSADSIWFTTFVGMADSLFGTLNITNTGSGELVWSIAEAAAWLAISPDSGRGNGTVGLAMDVTALTPGIYVEPIVVEAGGAVNSPDTLWLQLEVVDGMPFISLDPITVDFVSSDPSGISRTVMVENLGSGLLEWKAYSSAGWLLVNPDSGQSPDSFALTIDTSGLDFGKYAAEVEVIDSGAFNISEQIYVTLDYLPISTDSIIIGSAQVEALGTAEISVDLILKTDVTQIFLPLAIDSSLVTVDSILPGSEIAAVPGFGDIVTLDGESVVLTYTMPDSTLAAGNYQLATIFVTAHEFDGNFSIGPPVTDSLAARLVSVDSQHLSPVIVSGEMSISGVTEVEPLELMNLPESFSLAQNYPNPFNPVTVIPFELPVQTAIELEVYNILGQRIRSLASGVWPAGEHQVTWDGRFLNGRTAPTGIYFYRLLAADMSLVRKMLLVK